MDAEDDKTVAQAIVGAKRGDADAVRFLYVRVADNVYGYGYVRSIVRDEHEAEDITQDVFAKLIRVIGRYEDRGLPFHAWVLRVARNVAVDHPRSRRMVPREEIHAATEGDARHMGQERARELGAALSELPEEQREVLVLRHVVGMSPGEIPATSAGPRAPSTDSTTGGGYRSRVRYAGSRPRPPCRPGNWLRPELRLRRSREGPAGRVPPRRSREPTAVVLPSARACRRPCASLSWVFSYGSATLRAAPSRGQGGNS
jgi:RNA polymerase sigma-70 factor (ECF subfamily)